MVTTPGANLLAYVDSLKKHEQVFLTLHKQLIEDIVATGRKDSKFGPSKILMEKGIRYESSVWGKRVDYERRNENAYRSARAALLTTLRNMGARKSASYLYKQWNAIEKILPTLEKALVKPENWASGRGREVMYKTAERLFYLQEQIVNQLTTLEQQLQKR